MTIDEILVVVNIALGSSPLSACPAADADGSGEVTVDDVLMAVNASLLGCSAGPTPTPTTGPVPPVPGAGVSSNITAAVIGADGRIDVTFTLTDARGVPIMPVLGATQNPNLARVRLTVAHIEEYSGGGEFDNPFSRYVNDVNLTRPAYDSGGMLQTLDAGSGVYRYTFRTQLPEDFDPTETYAVGMQVDRTFLGQQLSANPVHFWVPAGGPPQVRAATTTEQCNTCHAPLIVHGNRREVELCLLCHTEASVDEMGRSIDFREMVHKIHMGKELPSIVDGPPGSKYAIFSSFQRQDIVFAEKHADGTISGVGFPRAIEACQVCHAEGPTAHYYSERPSAAACAACHDDVNPSQVETAAGPPGTGHFQNRGFADGDCTFCHVSDLGTEFDISVVGAHVIPARSRQLAGLKAEILGLTNHGAGQMPTVSFRVSDNEGTPLLALSGLNRLAFAISGPTTDYTSMIVPVAVGGGASGMLVGPDDEGVFQYTPNTAIPADASGTWAMGVEARRLVQLMTVDPIPPKSVQEAAVNEVVTFSVDGSGPMVRRAVVEDEKCGVCHGEFSKDFSIHGNLRNTMEFCVVCHNPNQSDVSRRQRDPQAVARGEETATIDFKVLIHKIHRGEELAQQPYLVYGFGPAPANFTAFDFGEVLFPGDLRDCQTCHTAGTYLLPPYPGTALPTRVGRLDPATGNEVVVGHMAPITAACTSCHDSEVAIAHADTQTSGSGVEACAICHEEGRSFPVSAAHAGRR